MNAAEWSDVLLSGKGQVAVRDLLARRLPLPTLRHIAKSHGLKPKGGFRVERADAMTLAALLAEQAQALPGVLAEVAAALGAAEAPAFPPPVGEPATAADGSEHLAAEVADLKSRLDKEAQSAARARQRRDEAVSERDEALRLRAELHASLQASERGRRALEEELTRLHAAERLDDQRQQPSGDLAARLQEVEAREAAARRRIAELSSQVRGLEEEVAELESYLPRGQRERRRQRDAAIESEPTPATLLPRFTDDFRRDLEGLDNEQQRRVFAALAQLILHGYEYPGLHAKALQGLDVWSIRAGVHLRVYFRREGDVVTLLDVGSREDQDSYLKRRRGY